MTLQIVVAQVLLQESDRLILVGRKSCHGKICPPLKLVQGDRFWQQKWSPRTGLDWIAIIGPIPCLNAVRMQSSEPPSFGL